MGAHKCDSCAKHFSRKENLDKHVSKAVCGDKKFDCKYCTGKFSTKSAMYRHMKEYCKIKKDQDNEKENILERLLNLEEVNKKLAKKNGLLEKEVVKLKKGTISSIQKTINNKCTTNINKGTINNIILVGYGKEDLTKLNRTELLKALHGGYYSTIKLTEAVHFNPKHPEYHNIYISNMKDKYAIMFDGKIWTLTTKKELINQIYEDKKNYIEENLEEFIDSLPVSRKNALQRWLDTDDEDPKIKEIKENLKLLLYNSRKLVHDEHKQPDLKMKSNTVKPAQDD